MSESALTASGVLANLISTLTDSRHEIIFHHAELHGRGTNGIDIHMDQSSIACQATPRHYGRADTDPPILPVHGENAGMRAAAVIAFSAFQSNMNLTAPYP